jgi:hypothetical protein
VCRTEISRETGQKTSTEEGVETYSSPPAGAIGDWKQMDLKTIEVWEGNESKEFEFSANTTPWVLNAGYVATGNVSASFEAHVWKDLEGYPGIRVGPTIRTNPAGISAVTMEELGKFTIEVRASGCNWWVKIGVKP